MQANKKVPLKSGTRKLHIEKYLAKMPPGKAALKLHFEVLP
ncbi:Hypothetical protein BROD_1016 [Brucella sp. NF 2653]|nr:Hypothetical protein BROD_1016 [Brucella sp. NF 2653]